MALIVATAIGGRDCLARVARNLTFMAPSDPDFPVNELLLLYRDRIRELLAGHGMSSPRVAGLAGTGRPVPAGVPVELYVDIAGVHDWNNGAARDVDLAIGAILGHPVVITHCPPGHERLLPGEQVWAL